MTHRVDPVGLWVVHKWMDFSLESEIGNDCVYLRLKYICAEFKFNQVFVLDITCLFTVFDI